MCCGWIFSANPMSCYRWTSDSALMLCVVGECSAVFWKAVTAVVGALHWGGPLDCCLPHCWADQPSLSISCSPVSSSLVMATTVGQEGTSHGRADSFSPFTIQHPAAIIWLLHLLTSVASPAVLISGVQQQLFKCGSFEEMNMLCYRGGFGGFFWVFFFF